MYSRCSHRRRRAISPILQSKLGFLDLQTSTPSPEHCELLVLRDVEVPLVDLAELVIHIVLFRRRRRGLLGPLGAWLSQDCKTLFQSLYFCPLGFHRRFGLRDEMVDLWGKGVGKERFVSLDSRLRQDQEMLLISKPVSSRGETCVFIGQDFAQAGQVIDAWLQAGDARRERPGAILGCRDAFVEISQKVDGRHDRVGQGVHVTEGDEEG